MVSTETKTSVAPQPKVGIITVPLDRTSLAILKAIQVELKLANQSETLQAILFRYWRGQGSEIGHLALPSE